MKRSFLLFLMFACFLFPAVVFAQTARIIGARGNVQVKKSAQLEWQKAKIDMMLEKNSQVQTQARSSCTITFDEGFKKIITIQENTEITLESVMPGNVFLPKGRVFTLIENLGPEEKFQVRTPTAIAGARGTGWLTGHQNGNTTANCFENTIFVAGLSPSGDVTGEEEVSNGFGINVGPEGNLGGIHPLGGSDYEQWDNFINYTDNLIDEGEDEDPGEDYTFPGEFRDEQRQDLKDFTGQGSHSSGSHESRSGSGTGDDHYKDVGR